MADEGEFYTYILHEAFGKRLEKFDMFCKITLKETPLKKIPAYALGNLNEL